MISRLVATPSTDELKAAFHRTHLSRLGYSFDKAMESEMFKKVLTDIVIATKLNKHKQRAPAPMQQALI